MALKAYYKNGLGLFTNTGGAVWEDTDLTMECNEQLLINLGAIPLKAYELTTRTYEYPVNSIFAQQPDNLLLYRFIDTLNPVKNVDAADVADAGFFTEVQYDATYLI